MMTVTLAPITADNWVICIELAPTPAQTHRGFVAPNVLSLAQAYAEPWWVPYAIYASDTMVGFILYGRWPETGVPAQHGTQPAGVDYILRIMIDQHHQGRGYGKAAMRLLIAQIAAQPGSHTIELDYDFHPVHETPDGEIIARLVLDSERAL